MMGLPRNTKLRALRALALILVCFSFEFCSSIDTITSTQPIKDPETIVSIGKIFKLGFFSPANSTNRYVGILYNIPVVIVVWVANGEQPLNDSSGTVTILEDSNLVILSGQKEIIWSSNVSNPVANSSAQLLETGNLFLRDNSSGRTVWESFQDPVDSFLQRMRIGYDAKTGERNLLTSWKSPSNPSIGTFSAGVDTVNIPQFFVWNGSHPYWRSGPWNGQIFIGVPRMYTFYLNGFNLVNDEEGAVYLTFTYANESTVIYYALNSEGTILEKYWVDGKEDWEVTWSGLENECDVYGKCGQFGSCNLLDSPVCTCLRGFEPKDKEEWSKGNWTSGCIRKTLLQCGNNTVNEEGKEN